MQARARALREQAESEFVQTEAECYRRVLVNRCLEQARQLRLERIREARALDIEARRIELAHRQQQLEREQRPEQADTTLRPIPQPTEIPQATPDLDAEELRLRREAERLDAEVRAAESRARRDTERRAERERAEAAAARRAERAERDRQRYEERQQRRLED